MNNLIFVVAITIAATLSVVNAQAEPVGETCLRGSARETLTEIDVVDLEGVPHVASIGTVAFITSCYDGKYTTRSLDDAVSATHFQDYVFIASDLVANSTPFALK